MRVFIFADLLKMIPPTKPDVCEYGKVVSKSKNGIAIERGNFCDCISDAKCLF